jgi:hypothetical protein
LGADDQHITEAFHYNCSSFNRAQEPGGNEMNIGRQIGSDYFN